MLAFFITPPLVLAPWPGSKSGAGCDRYCIAARPGHTFSVPCLLLHRHRFVSTVRLKSRTFPRTQSSARARKLFELALQCIN